MTRISELETKASAEEQEESGSSQYTSVAEGGEFNRVLSFLHTSRRSVFVCACAHV